MVYRGGKKAGILGHRTDSDNPPVPSGAFKLPARPAAKAQTAALRRRPFARYNAAVFFRQPEKPFPPQNKETPP